MVTLRRVAKGQTLIKAFLNPQLRLTSEAKKLMEAADSRC